MIAEGNERTIEDVQARRMMDIEGEFMLGDIDVDKVAKLRVLAIMNSEANKPEGE